MTFFLALLFFGLVSSENSQIHTGLYKLQAHSQIAIDALRPPTLHLQGQLTQACQSAWVLFSQVWGNTSSCSIVSSLYSNTTDATQVPGILKTYCVDQDTQNHTCQQKVSYTLLNIFASCKGDPNFDVTQLEPFRWYLTVANAACLKDTVDDHWCFVDFKHLSELDWNTLSLNGLNSVCTDCNRRIINTFKTFATKDIISVFVGLELLCYQMNGEYCALKFQAASAATVANNNGPPTPALLDAWCDDCVKNFVGRMIWANVFTGSANATQIQEEVKLFEFTKLYCVENAKGDYCLIAASTYNMTKLAPCLVGLQSGGTTCSAECKAALMRLEHDLGCCATTWLNFLKLAYASDPSKFPANPDQIRHFITDTCGTHLPYGCATKKILATITLQNVAWAWYNNHLVQAKADLLLYVSWLLAVDSAIIADLAITQAGSSLSVVNAHSSSVHHLMSNPTDGLTVSFTVLPTSDQQASTATSAVTSSTGSINNLASSWPLDARTNASLPIIVGTADATGQNNPSGAFRVTPLISFLVTIGAFLALFL